MANKYWCIDQSISYSNTTAIFSSAAGIVDTGECNDILMVYPCFDDQIYIWTTLVHLASDAFEKYNWQSATWAGAIMDSATGLLHTTSSQYSNLSSLYFHINSIADAECSNLASLAIGGDTSGIYLIVNELGRDIPQDLEFISGYTFLERFYTCIIWRTRELGLLRLRTLILRQIRYSYPN
ncbi:uncharacterized protein BT62DRAFT_1055068 [Guyanagaster necrorhizus]|uniref:Uncharacterized protein n=1 Tax=Guyanagaster necrorhizus TaxID=856835 RepID=A0A9P7VFQ5_9AGAR|nr:uncharacterized protein BT62DRAFT_1055068 [Guyanagaster necrorhizus MCA 3950]KAG7439742.1 hypothetical protein BT62DRAFT_1055068 [Guyanagaster necrorhizus MCA 3950]